MTGELSWGVGKVSDLELVSDKPSSSVHELAGIIAVLGLGRRVGRCKTFYVAKLRMLIWKMGSTHRKVSLTVQVVFNLVRCAVSIGTSRWSATFHKQSETHQISGLASVSLCNQVQRRWNRNTIGVGGAGIRAANQLIIRTKRPHAKVKNWWGLKPPHPPVPPPLTRWIYNIPTFPGSPALQQKPHRREPGNEVNHTTL